MSNRDDTTDLIPRASRRRLLQTAAVGVGAAVAGCAGGGSDDTDDDGDDDGSADAPGDGGNGLSASTWPMRGRTPGRTYATPAQAPASLEDMEQLVNVRSAPLVTEAGLLTYGMGHPLTLTDAETGETRYESEYQPSRGVFVHDDTIIFYSDGGFVGVGLESGERAWREEVGSSDAVALFPAGDAFGYWGKTETDGGEVKPELVVLDADSREQRWNERLSDANRHFGKPVVDVGSGTVFVADVPDKSFSNAERYLRAYDLQSGEQRWRIEGRYEPRAARDGRLLATHRRPEAGSPELVELDADGGDRKWGREGRELALRKPAFGADTVYVRADSTIHAIGPDGEDRWSYRVQGGKKLTAVAATADGVVIGARSRVLVVEPEGSVVAEYDLADDGGYSVNMLVPTADRIHAVDQKLGFVTLSDG